MEATGRRHGCLVRSCMDLLTAAAKSDFQELPRVWRHTNAAHSTDDTADPSRGAARLHIIERQTLSTATSSQAPNSYR